MGLCRPRASAASLDRPEVQVPWLLGLLGPLQRATQKMTLAQGPAKPVPHKCFFLIHFLLPPLRIGIGINGDIICRVGASVFMF